MRLPPVEFVRSPEALRRIYTPAEACEYTRWLATPPYRSEDGVRAVAGGRDGASASRVRPLAGGLAAHLHACRSLRIHALAGHPPLRELPRGELPAAQAPAPGLLQRLRVLPLGRRP